MSEIICTAPINIAKVNPSSSGKALPVVVGQLMQLFSCNAINNIVLWNRGDLDISSSNPKNVSDTLSLFGINIQDINQQADDDPLFHSWMLNLVDRALHKGKLTLRAEKVLACSHCGQGMVLASSRKAPGICAGCQRPPSPIEKESLTMCMSMPHSQDELERVVSFCNLPENFKGQLTSLPKQILLSKPRQKGTPLDDFGLKGLKIDPRVTNAALLAYQAEKSGCDIAWGIVGKTHVNKIAPYFYGFGNLSIPRVGFLGISKMPVDEILCRKELIDRYGKQPVLNTLATLSLAANKWEGPQRLKEIETYCRRIGHAVHSAEEINSFAGIAFKRFSSKMPMSVSEAVKEMPKLVMKYHPK